MCLLRNVQNFFDELIDLESRRRVVKKQRGLSTSKTTTMLAFNYFLANAAFRSKKDIFDDLTVVVKTFLRTKRNRAGPPVLASIHRSRQHNGIVFQWHPFKFRSKRVNVLFQK